jgi:Spy/CpxP family protein refolding chaperone
MQRRHAFAAALAALVLIPALAQAAPARRPSPQEILRSPKLLARYLALTPAQVTQEEALFTTLRNTLQPINEQQKTQRELLAAELDKPTPNACTVGGYVVTIHGLYEQAEAAFHTFDTAFSAILTPEQLAKYNALKELANPHHD